jgi:AcrR family transcriptional regulator
MARPAYRRLEVEERRRQLLERGAELFTRYSYDELSMRKIAREAGISKALLYHYFPSKQAFFQATLARAAEQLRARTEPDPKLPPLEQIQGSLEAFLELIDENALAYRKLMQGATSVPEVRELVDDIRTRTAQRILDGVFPDGAPVKARIAVHGWLWFMDGACLNWIEHRDLSRDGLRDLLLGALLGALAAADAVPFGAAPQPEDSVASAL